MFCSAFSFLVPQFNTVKYIQWMLFNSYTLLVVKRETLETMQLILHFLFLFVEFGELFFTTRSFFRHLDLDEQHKKKTALHSCKAFCFRRYERIPRVKYILYKVVYYTKYLWTNVIYVNLNPIKSLIPNVLESWFFISAVCLWKYKIRQACCSLEVPPISSVVWTPIGSPMRIKRLNPELVKG